MDVLGDGEARQILQAAGTPITVAGLADELGLSTSSAYRKVGLLEDLGLLEPTNPEAPATMSTRYRRTVRTVAVRFGRDMEVTCAFEGE